MEHNITTQNVDEEDVQNTEPAVQKDRFSWGVGIFSIISFAAFWLGALLFLLGGATVNDENLNVVSAINLLLSIFSMKKATLYSSFTNLVIAVMYLVIIIKLIYTLITMLRLFLLSLRGETHDIRGKATVDVYYTLIDSFLMYYVMMFVSFMLTGGSLNLYSILIIALNVAVSLFAAVLGPIRSTNPDDNGNTLDRIFDCIRKILMMAAVCLIIYLLAEPAMLEVRSGLKLLLSGYYNEELGALGVIVNIYSCAARPVLVCVAIGLLLNLFHGYTKYLFPRRNSYTIYTYRLKANSITVLVIVCIIAVLDLLLLFGEYSGEVALDSATIENWLRVSKTTIIPAIVAAVSGVVLSAAADKSSRS